MLTFSQSQVPARRRPGYMVSLKFYAWDEKMTRTLLSLPAGKKDYFAAEGLTSSLVAL